MAGLVLLATYQRALADTRWCSEGWQTHLPGFVPGTGPVTIYVGVTTCDGDGYVLSPADGYVLPVGWACGNPAASVTVPQDHKGDVAGLFGCDLSAYAGAGFQWRVRVESFSDGEGGCYKVPHLTVLQAVSAGGLDQWSGSPVPSGIISSVSSDYEGQVGSYFDTYYGGHDTVTAENSKRVWLPVNSASPPAVDTASWYPWGTWANTSFLMGGLSSYIDATSASAPVETLQFAEAIWFLDSHAVGTEYGGGMLRFTGRRYNLRGTLCGDGDTGGGTGGGGGSGTGLPGSVGWRDPWTNGVPGLHDDGTNSPIWGLKERVRTNGPMSWLPEPDGGPAIVTWDLTGVDPEFGSYSVDLGAEKYAVFRRLCRGTLQWVLSLSTVMGCWRIVMGTVGKSGGEGEED